MKNLQWINVSYNLTDHSIFQGNVNYLVVSISPHSHWETISSISYLSEQGDLFISAHLLAHNLLDGQWIIPSISLHGISQNDTIPISYLSNMYQDILGYMVPAARNNPSTEENKITDIISAIPDMYFKITAVYLFFFCFKLLEKETSLQTKILEGHGIDWLQNCWLYQRYEEIQLY